MYGSDKFLTILNNNKTRPILLYGDPDTDGLFSLLLMCQFADMLGLTYTFYVNHNREHGFLLDPEKLKGYLVLTADFGISQDDMKRLVSSGITILATDHHECQDTFIEHHTETDSGIYINNQYPFEPKEKQYLSGAGVFYELACELYPEFKTHVRDALVGATLLSDMRPIENKLARKYLSRTYSVDPQDTYISYLIENSSNSDFGFGIPKFDRNLIDYYLNPLINALLRADRTDEAVKFILGAGLTTSDTRGFQKSILEEMHLKAGIYPYNSVTFLVVKQNDYKVDITNYIGLFCNDYKDKNNGVSVLGMVVQDGVVTRASFRGKYDNIHYKTSFIGLGIDARGHAGAFGIKNFNPTSELFVEIDEVIGDLEDTYTPSINIIETTNLSLTLNSRGGNIALENCYVRDMYRTYIRYTGTKININRQTYKTIELTPLELNTGVTPDLIKDGIKLKYLRDKSGNLIPKYIEYEVDGRLVKSFGVSITDGLILPILEKGYINLYVRGQVV